MGVDQDMNVKQETALLPKFAAINLGAFCQGERPGVARDVILHRLYRTSPGTIATPPKSRKKIMIVMNLMWKMREKSRKKMN